MPDYTSNFLHIFCPHDRMPDLREALSGPCDWAFSLEITHPGKYPTTQLTQHQILSIEKGSAALIGQFMDRAVPRGWPRWMKPGKADIKAFVAGEHPFLTEDTPFSVARLLPYDDADKRVSFFPDSAPNQSYRTPNAQGIHPCDFRTRKIGTKWTPHVSRVERREGPDSPGALLFIAYDTAWSPISNLADCLTDTLHAHDAKALLTWEVSGDCGYDLINPARDIALSREFPDPDRFQSAENEDGEESDVITFFDLDLFERTVAEEVDDPDFGL